MRLACLIVGRVWLEYCISSVTGHEKTTSSLVGSTYQLLFPVMKSSSVFVWLNVWMVAKMYSKYVFLGPSRAGASLVKQ